ncbi:MAG: S41 family peptidase [Bacteroidales bacterium]|nr:S41 family peptidase [Bacteroidales bacterium]MBR1795179.1 S41 family peptidase [Bacteroidales bacterium]
MKRTRYALAVLAAALLATATASAQSKSFSLGKWVELHNAILKELNRSYVDSLEVGRIEREGVDAMLEALDPYTVYVPEEEQEDFQMMLSNTYGGIGAVIYKPDKNGNVMINEPYAGSPAAKAGLVCGDEIETIDGVSTHGLTSQECSDKMRGKPGTQVVFRVKKLRDGASWKAGETIDVTVTRERIALPSVEYVGMLNDSDGYILLTKFTEGVGQGIRDGYHTLKAQGMKRLVLDLRSNGGGVMSEAVNIVSLFVPKGSVVVTSKGKAKGSGQEYKTTTDPVDLEIPLVVLVDSGSASASEIVSGALQDLDRATIIGTRTYGKGLVQSIRPLPYDGQLKVTTAKYYTPSGRCVQAIDYSHRNEDGSVGHIPDSLTHEFKTLHGRTVRDGGGIMPDHEVKGHKYSRLTYSIVLNGIVDQYAMKYVREHEALPSVEDFHFDAYDDFVAFAKDKEFDYRSSARALFDEMKKIIAEDGLTETMSDELAALEKSLDMDKETFLRLKKDEILPFIEEEIAVRYWFQQAGIQVRLRYDDQLKEALTKPAISW